MEKNRKNIILASIFTFCISGSVFLYITGWLPNQKMLDLRWWESVSPDEIREVGHQVLRYPFGNHHDAFLALENVGNAESVPLLIKALKWHETLDNDGFVACTTDHCLSALHSLTGVDKGTSFKVRDEWWEHTGSSLPAEVFYPKASKQPTPSFK